MERKNLIKFWANFTKNLIIINPGRFVILFISILLLTISALIPNQTKFYKVDRYIVDGDKHYYETTSSYTALEYDTEQKLFQDGSDTLIKVVEWHELRVITIVILSILFLVFIGSLFIEELELNKVRKKTIINNFTERHIEGQWVYTSYNKLLKKSIYKRDVDEVMYGITIRTHNDFLNLEDFYTKAEIREGKLNKLGI
jgi:competence protein ComGC